MSKKIFRPDGDKVLKRLAIALNLDGADNKTFAGILGTKQAAITNYRKNKRPLPLHKLYELSQENDFSLDWLLTGKAKQQIVKVYVSREGFTSSSIEWTSSDPD